VIYISKENNFIKILNDMKELIIIYINIYIYIYIYLLHG